MSRDRELVGVGGWLAFFVVVIGILSPLRIVIEMVILQRDPEMPLVFGDSWPMINGLEWALSAFQLALCFFMAWRLLKMHEPQTVRLVIAGLWIIGPGVMLVEFLLIGALTDLPVGELLAAGGGVEVVRSIVFATVWTAFFRMSKRVANTYHQAQGAQAAEVFS